MEQQLDEFMQKTGADIEQAIHYLELCYGDIQQAEMLYYAEIDEQIRQSVISDNIQLKKSVQIQDEQIHQFITPDYPVLFQLKEKQYTQMKECYQTYVNYPE
ncbi:UBA-like domain-containing protein [Spironucleus salmonicida]|uniref:UBA-like domain-containing protein n=1 Tax=Spironucleus salmonicida TaxID=348837 RepID=V6LEP5_9EUKA|nr:UBA-like domain-containing protein [Spironucleus salmonicida]|eukprot:EST42995.1 Hypothetical protein SS50377_17296 [Spironucleus salmonicida]